MFEALPLAFSRQSVISRARKPPLALSICTPESAPRARLPRPKPLEPASRPAMHLPHSLVHAHRPCFQTSNACVRTYTGQQRHPHWHRRRNRHRRFDHFRVLRLPGPRPNWPALVRLCVFMVRPPPEHRRHRKVRARVQSGSWRRAAGRVARAACVRARRAAVGAGTGSDRETPHAHSLALKRQRLAAAATASPRSIQPPPTTTRQGQRQAPDIRGVRRCRRRPRGQPARADQCYQPRRHPLGGLGGASRMAWGLRRPDPRLRCPPCSAVGLADCCEPYARLALCTRNDLRAAVHIIYKCIHSSVWQVVKPNNPGDFEVWTDDAATWGVLASGARAAAAGGGAFAWPEIRR